MEKEKHRLIDANVLADKLKQHHDFFVNAWGGFQNLPVKDKARVDEITHCIAEIGNAKTVDAVEVVRCKDCKKSQKWKNAFGTEGLKCYLLCANIDPDDFCSYGERKSNDV